MMMMMTGGAIVSAREGRRGEGRGLRPCRVGRPKWRGGEEGGARGRGLATTQCGRGGEAAGRGHGLERREGRGLSPRSFSHLCNAFLFPRI
jgi:hypothetical protein